MSIRIGNLLGNFFDSFPRASAVALVPSSPDVSWSGRSHHPSASTSPPAPLSRPASSSPFLASKSPSEAFGREARKEKSMTRRCNWPSSAFIRDPQNYFGSLFDNERGIKTGSLIAKKKKNS